MTGLRTVHTGPLSLVQDLGRIGHLRSGVGVSGAADTSALRLANRLVGNPDSAAGIEVLMGGLEIVAERSVTMSVTGAPAQAYLDSTPVGHASVIHVRPGQTVRLGYAPIGVRVYVAARGGIAVPEILGSRSTDTLSGIGPPPLRPGDLLPIGPAPAHYSAVDLAPVPPVPGGTLDITVLFGPRERYFVDPDVLTRGEWIVSAESDRVGIRLDRSGSEQPLRRTDQRELPTEGMVVGSIQVPPSGQPVVFLADHPITGGYPVIGVVTAADVNRLAQARPGQHLRFVRGVRS
ncbi:biotin-dependent carboxylase-like uncharacterized protein [Rhodococcus sp. 27YEA15]|uniref:5-oxoprolinase subunit C family protein n=1 Tax=Rhodococcus sp. 27YEA15 TaxID=3156259 RepID=UPI003C7D37B0